MSDLVQIDLTTAQPPPTGDGIDVVNVVCAEIDEYLSATGTNPHPLPEAWHNDDYRELIKIASRIRRKITGTNDWNVNLKNMATDLQKRASVGFQKYGTRLKTDNGRAWGVDLYQELLDAINYYRKDMLELK